MTVATATAVEKAMVGQPRLISIWLDQNIEKLTENVKLRLQSGGGVLFYPLVPRLFGRLNSLPLAIAMTSLKALGLIYRCRRIRSIHRAWSRAARQRRC